VKSIVTPLLALGRRDERPEWSGLADPEVMALALAEGRAIVTADAGDRELGNSEHWLEIQLD